MLIVGVVLLLVAAAAAWYARHERAQARAVTATETSTCGELLELAKGVGAEVGSGGFQQRAEVVGAAAADGAPGRAPESGTDAVWHRTTVTHRYWQMERRERDGQTHWDRVEHRDVVSDLVSEAGFVVDDGTGQVVVAPAGADVDHPEQVVDRFDRHDGSGSAGAGVLDSVLSAVLLSGDRSGTIGFETEEWIIRPGARLYVHGEVSDASGRLRFAKPDKGRYVISTRSEQEIVRGDRRNAAIALGAAAVAAVAGVVLVVLGAVS